MPIEADDTFPDGSAPLAVAVASRSSGFCAKPGMSLGTGRFDGCDSRLVTGKRLADATSVGSDGTTSEGSDGTMSEDAAGVDAEFSAEFGWMGRDQGAWVGTEAERT